ncbi:MAG TPA: type II secretion system protein GspJ [Neisseriales bacterium]|jgi:general secretion pathway protein J|nr:type II secretion system minor pseudopilin GspJ [Burkholderiales bacterium]MBP9769277.1 type II secretion system minor pseudopilin GspJ [Burkholderiales bacterium]HCY39601.1 type II secretion system protein GspJ [Neisseriales bacterium]
MSKYNNKHQGFTLIEIMISVIIFAIISVISYRIITSLINTKQIAGGAQEKWGNLSLINSNMGTNWNRSIPLVVRDGNGAILPALQGKPKLSSNYDSQLELTISGYIGDDVYGTTPPKRIGYRFNQGSLYLVTWPVLNRVLTTVPQIDLLIDNVQTFSVLYLYQDKQWHDSWPPEGGDPTVLPRAVKLQYQLKSGESVERVKEL